MGVSSDVSGSAGAEKKSLLGGFDLKSLLAKKDKTVIEPAQ